VIDGVKIAFYCETMENILSSLGIDIDERKLGRAGLLKWSKAKHRHLVFTIYPGGRVVIDGSLHKYWKGENYSDFSFAELCECISHLCQTFQINPLQARIHNLEFGVNIATVFEPFDFCDHVIGYLDGLKPFKEMDEGEPVIGFKCERTEYGVKVYSKERQYIKAANILRFEKAVNRMRAIQAVCIKTLSDLTERAKIEKLGYILNETFADLIIGDEIDTSNLSTNELAVYNRGSNPKAWGKMNRWERFTLKPEFRRIVDAYGKNKWIVPTGKMIDEKWRMLLVINSQTANVLTGVKENIQKDNVTNVLPDLLNPVEKIDCKRSPCLDNMGERNTPGKPQRFCKTCVRDISNQKKGSVFCSAKYVGEKQAKLCRNVDSNPRNNFSNREKKKYSGLNLFGINQFLGGNNA
jgi:hypothetical protein